MGSESFDSRATEWDSDPDKVSRAQAVAASILREVPVNDTDRLLEYGAGTGLVTQALGDAVGQVVLADNSSGMREVMRQKIEAGFLTDAQVWDLNLEQDALPDERFDLIATSMVMHHVRDLPLVLSAFASLLRPGGHLCIADLDREDGSFHQADFDGHHGFDREELTGSLHGAGFSDAAVTDCTSISKGGRPYSVFLAVARR